MKVFLKRFVLHRGISKSLLRLKLYFGWLAPERYRRATERSYSPGMLEQRLAAEI